MFLAFHNFFRFRLSASSSRKSFERGDLYTGGGVAGSEPSVVVVAAANLN